ncbi:BQ5605_C001g00688 [Microbotryum silenes-dioicae]|uniref:BQ5605_C001g00688 protein n=1 Tax=Microbotryum silenes-dioicae TaxID=796604 RepID=A0A2X0M855_9BASI|nr:BQ5605_C001g00688 [Microbotryum silenes-dioicae]
MACLDSSPGRINRTEVWISRDEMVDFWLYFASLDASRVMRSKMSLTNELRISIALFEIPVSGWTCFNTLLWTGQGRREIEFEFRG